MSPLILILIQLFGPLLVELIKKLLDKWFARAEKNLKGKIAGTGRDAQIAVLKETLRILPKTAVIRRKVVRKMLQLVEDGRKANSDDVKQLLSLVAGSVSE